MGIYKTGKIDETKSRLCKLCISPFALINVQQRSLSELRILPSSIQNYDFLQYIIFMTFRRHLIRKQ